MHRKYAHPHNQHNSQYLPPFLQYGSLLSAKSQNARAPNKKNEGNIMGCNPTHTHTFNWDVALSCLIYRNRNMTNKAQVVKHVKTYNDKLLTG